MSEEETAAAFYQLTCKQRDAAWREVETLRQERDEFERRLDATAATLEAICLAAEGQPVSDFMESFSGVRLVLDLRQERDEARTVRDDYVEWYRQGLAERKELEAQLTGLREALEQIRDVLGDLTLAFAYRIDTAHKMAEAALAASPEAAPTRQDVPL